MLPHIDMPEGLRLGEEQRENRRVTFRPSETCPVIPVKRP